MRGDRQHGRAAAMAVVEAIEQVDVARAAAARRTDQLASQLCLGASRERANFFVPHVDPLDTLIAAHGLR